MSEHEGRWAAGTPCWSDLGVGDVDRAVAFYTDLLGWEFTGDEAVGDYRRARVHGRQVAGIGGKMSPDDAAQWFVTIASDDVDATAAAIEPAGGTVQMPPTDIEGLGRMLLAVDPQGAVFGVWQDIAQGGYMVVNEPGAVCWNEVHAADAAPLREFYPAVFGYSLSTFGDPSEPYTTMSLTEQSERPVAGVFAPPTMAPDAPAYWLTWFAVPSADGAVATVREHCGQVLMEPYDSPFGRSAMVTGPEGELFGVIELATPEVDEAPED
jgi:uncharacterized protein